MGPNTQVTLDCASGDDKIGTRTLNDGQALSWSFKPHVFGRTLFWCVARVSDGRTKHWDVYKGKQRSQNWYLRGDGIYTGDVRGNGLLKKHSW